MRAAFADQGQVLLPILELIENARTSIDELMSEAARGFVEQLLVLSAQEVAGAKHLGRRMGEVLCELLEVARSALAYRSVRAERDAPSLEAMKRPPDERRRSMTPPGRSRRR